MSESQERAFIHRTIAVITQSTGARPKGWLGTCPAESHCTPDLLADAGIEYVSDYAHDELPVELRVRTGSLITVPYTLEMNDVPTILGKGASAEVFAQMIRDQFDVLHEEAATLPRVMALSVHPFITGHPFRMKHFAAALAYIASHHDVWLTTGGGINDWYRKNFMTTPAGGDSEASSVVST